MEEKRQYNQVEPTYSSSTPMREVALKTYRKQWTIRRGGEDEDDDDLSAKDTVKDI